MGLDIISFNVQNFSDSNGVIEDLGIDNISQIKKKAAIAKAEADKEIAVAKAEADRQANDAKTNSDREIAIKNNELDIQKAELKKNADIKQAEADAAYQIQQEEQRKTIEITTADADIAKQEKEIVIKQKEAEAQKARAAADRYTKEQEAQGIRSVGEAETESIRAKGLAEAEAMEKKAEAYQKYTGAAVAEMMIRVLPEMAGKIAEPLAQIDKITIIGSGKESGVDAIAGNVPAVMAKLFESMKESTGIDLGEIVRANTYDAKVNRNVHVTGLTREDAALGEVLGAAMDGETKE